VLNQLGDASRLVHAYLENTGQPSHPSEFCQASYRADLY